MLRSGIFNSVHGDRKYKAEDFASYFATFVGNGVFPNPSTGFQVTASNGMTIALKPGKAWINGYYIVNDADHNMTLDVADGVLKRIDRIVLQLNHIDREISPVIKKGVFASSPVAPAIQRDSDAYELVLADVLVANGTISVIQGNITDQRLNSELCGIVHGTVDQVDTTSIFNQYQSWFESYSIYKASEFDIWTEEQKTSYTIWRELEETLFATWSADQRAMFTTWFDNVKGQLSTDPAGHLQVQIDAHKAASMPHQYTDTTTNKRFNWGMGAENGVAFLLIEEDV